jgi:hypothetical protein
MFTIDTTQKSSRAPLPRGFVNAVCADFYTKEVDDHFNPGEKKTEVVLTFITTHMIKDRDGNVRNGAINLFANATWGSADKPSNLKKFIFSWFGPLADDKLKSFDFEKLLGRKVCILVEHYLKKDNSTGDKVALATDIRADLPQIDGIPADFTKMADRKPREMITTKAPASAPVVTSVGKAMSVDEAKAQADDDLPF